MKKAEVYILSGFLGSGKTTLLKRLLEDERKNNRKVAVMMNELGNISIDSGEVGEDVALKELLGGCICCTMSGQVEAQMQGLLLLEKPDAIYVETTGAAHPVEVIDAMLSPLFADQIDLKGIISTIDGKRWLERAKMSPQLQMLIIEQARHADFLIVNKASELSEKEKADIAISLQAINPKVNCILTDYSKVPLHSIRNLTSSGTKGSVDYPLNTKSLGLGTYVQTFQTSVGRERFEHFLRSLPDTIYRIKGYIKFHGSPYPELFQYSYGMPTFLKEDMNIPLNMVFIGENVDWDKIQTELTKLENE